MMEVGKRVAGLVVRKEEFKKIFPKVKFIFNFDEFDIIKNL